MTYSKFIYYFVSAMCIICTMHGMFGKDEKLKQDAFKLGQMYFLAQSIIFVVLYS